MFVLGFIVSIVVVIMIHEAGHFGTAKAFGMKAERFFLGFGPTLWSVRKGETTYGVKAIPAGGFVTIAGMTPFDDSIDPADDGRLFYQKPAWQRLIVLVAGSATHVVMAVVLLFAALAFVGLPQLTSGVAAVTPDSPAAEAGLEPGVEILSVDGVPTASFDDVRELIQPRAGETVELVVAFPDGTRRELTVTLDTAHPDGSDAGFLGVAPQAVDVPLGVSDGLEATFSGDFSVWRMTSLTVQGLVEVFNPSSLADFFATATSDDPRDPETITSLVGVGAAVNSFGQEGDTFAVLAILAQLNLVLGILNMLPLPPLDGGHVAVLAIEQGVNGLRRLRGRAADYRLDPSLITPVALAVMAFFIVVSLTAIYVDITKPVTDLLQ